MQRAFTILLFVCSFIGAGGCAGVVQPDDDPVALETLATLNTLETRMGEFNTELNNDLDDHHAFVGEAHSESREQMAQMLSALTALQQKVEQTCKPTAVRVQKCESQTVVMHGDRMVVGQIEKVRVDPPGFVVDAKIDTGAQSSSLHAENITEFERDGEDWVRFHIDNDGTDLIIERPVEKYVKVIQQSDKEGSRRAVVKLRIVIGNIKESFEFTLADRAHLAQYMILGKNFLTDLAVVDVGREFVQKLPKGT